MTLSNCPDCKYNGDSGCAVQPDYWEVRRTITGNLTTEIQKPLEPLIADCKDWESAPDLESLTLSITLTQREWMAIAQAKAVSKNIIPQVRTAIDFTPTNDFDDIPF